jgi:hypothetical protein
MREPGADQHPERFLRVSEEGPVYDDALPTRGDDAEAS